MQFGSDAAPVPPVDRALGAALTFFVTAGVGSFGAAFVDPTLPAAAGPAGVARGAIAGVLGTLLLVLGDGYAYLRVAVEGRRWTIELAVVAVAVLAASALVDLVPTLTIVWVALGAAVVYYGTVHVGERVAEARDWYDRDAYAWRRRPRPTADSDHR
ncbi:hypothetical protein [Halorubellus litoreus]|uniref:SPW repeat-containing protein n=1 Tax=Halorubellus litoreus TaxID=755308 RepID=A0ABD5V964_9EURY